MKRVIRFEEVIHRSAIEDLLTELRRVDSPRRVYVSSPGGKFDFFSTLGPAIERQGIITHSGDVRSAAIILFLLGHTRQALPNSTFFFHEIRTLVGPQGEISITEMEEVQEYASKMGGKTKEAYQEWLRQMKASQAWFLQFLREKSGLPTSTFLNLMRSEATLSAREAIHYGIVHEILPEGSLD